MSNFEKIFEENFSIEKFMIFVADFIKILCQTKNFKKASILHENASNLLDKNSQFKGIIKKNMQEIKKTIQKNI